MIFLWITLFTLFKCIVGPESIQHIDPKRLTVATIIDPTSPTIVRDALTLLRSIRLYGGLLNEATILIGIVLDSRNLFYDDALIDSLHQLNVTVRFVSQITSPLTKTLNKFEIFKTFDSTKYDYFLWLDADVVVTNDPIPHLRIHFSSGEIDCVPDFYSYMRRYPSINNSNIFWNTNLSSFKLLGEMEVAPHGACNTGVLYFDSISLSKFLLGYQNIMKDTHIVERYGHDRFFDSLVFIYAVNTLQIEVSIFSYSLNYMAFFEVEIMELTTTSEVIFIHFLTDTEMFCEMVEHSAAIQPLSESSSTTCNCVYKTSLPVLPSDSLIIHEINRKFMPFQNCRKMAGFDPMITHEPIDIPKSYLPFIDHPNTVPQQVTINTSSHHPTECFVLQPLQEGVKKVIRIQSHHALQHNVTQDIRIHCNHLLHSNFSIKLQIRWIASDEDNSNAATFGGEASFHYIVDDNFRCDALNCKGNVEYDQMEMNLKLNINSILQKMRSLAATHTIVRFSIDLTITDDDRLTHRFQFSGVPLKIFMASTPHGQWSYTKNLLVGSRQVSLDSQLNLVDYLHDRSLLSTGVIVCCETWKGVLVTNRLISEWKGDYLLVHVQDAPPNGTIHELIEQFRIHSQNSFTRLLIHSSRQQPMSESSFELWQLSKMMARDSLSFVFIDVMTDSFGGTLSLYNWFQNLQSYGIMIGSRFQKPVQMHFERKRLGGMPMESMGRVHYMTNNLKLEYVEVYDSSTDHKKISERKMLYQFERIYRTVNAFSESQQLNYLVTFDEKNLFYCDYFMLDPYDSHFDCLPAWYFIKS